MLHLDSHLGCQPAFSQRIERCGARTERRIVLRITMAIGRELEVPRIACQGAGTRVLTGGALRCSPFVSE